MKLLQIFLVACLIMLPFNADATRATRAELAQLSQELEPVLEALGLATQNNAALGPAVTKVQQFSIGQSSAEETLAAIQSALDATEGAADAIAALIQGLSFSPVKDTATQAALKQLERSALSTPETVRETRAKLVEAKGYILAGDKAGVERVVQDLASIGAKQLKLEIATFRAEMLTMGEKTPQWGLHRALIASHNASVKFFETGSGTQQEIAKKFRALPDGVSIEIAEMRAGIEHSRIRLERLQNLPDVELANAFQGGIGDIALMRAIIAAWADAIPVEEQLADMFEDAIGAIRDILKGQNIPENQERLFAMDRDYERLSAMRGAVTQRRISVLNALQSPKL